MTHEEHTGRRRADQALVLALAAGAPVDVAAQRAGVSRTTAHRRMREPEFRQMVQEARAAAFERALGELSDASLDAARTLRKLLRARNAPIQLGAAKAILELGVKLREGTELAERIAALEGRVP